jgi:iron complex outermembrane receptor protein
MLLHGGDGQFTEGELNIQSRRQGLLATTAFIGIGFACAAPAFAQDAPIQEVVVTGSRIPQPNLNSISPITAVSAAEVKLEGTTRVEDLLNNLPQVFADQGSTVSNGSRGTATVDLRGLGSTRTLVLVDGKRVVPGDPGDPSVDLNFIPVQLVDRVEVDTGGASAVYGSDAIAGVVNFIMKKNFTGVQLDAQYSFYQHDNDDSGIQSIEKASNDAYPTGGITDGYQTSVSAIVGVSSPDGKGNLEAYATYRSVQAVLEADRDYTACTLQETGPAFACGGSSTTSPPRLYLVTGAPGATGVNGNSYTTVGNGTGTTLRAYNGATDSFNYGPYNYLQRPDTHYTLGAIGHYEISPMADVYTQLMFMDDNSESQVAPGGIFYGNNFNVPCNNPYLTPGEITTFCGGSTSAATSFVLRPGKRNVEGGGRDQGLHHQDYRLQLGIKGQLDRAWSYDAYIQYATATQLATDTNFFSTARIQTALSPALCAAATGCVLYNLFQGGGSTVTPAQLNYIQVPGITGGTTVEQVANFSLTGQLGEYGWRSPFAEDGVGVALGTEYRREYLSEYADAESLAGDLSGAGGSLAPTTGSYDVYELFAEVRAPLVQNKPFARSVNIDLAYRFSDYSTAGATDTYAALLDWSPVKDLRLRGSFQRAVRAPNVLELFSPQNVTLSAYTDPCGPVKTYTLAQCENTGVTPATYGSQTIIGSSASQSYQLTGGNPDLKPEVADTYSGGFVFQPSFLPGFNLTVDYFNIFVANVISTIPPQVALQNCALQDSTFYCGLIHRDPTGSLGLNATAGGYVIGTNINAGSLQTNGVDMDITYRFPLSRIGLDHFGALNFDSESTFLNALTSEPVPNSGQKFNCAGYYGDSCGSPSPKFRTKTRLTWNTPWYGLQVSGEWRYLGDAKVDLLNGSPLINGDLAANGALPDAKLPAQSYFDLSASFKIRDNYTFRVGVQNIFDVSPPVVGQDECPVGLCNGNVYSQTYDSLGRYIYFGLTATY